MLCLRRCKLKNIAIITARGGSKRIPMKNIKEFMGKPMIAYAIDAAIKSEIFDEIMVSTEDLKIAEIAKKYGAKVPFLRSEKTANDFATTEDVLNEVINEYKKLGIEFDNICCIYPCVPLLTPKTLKEAYEVFINSKQEALMPVVRFSFPIQRAVILNKYGYLEFREPQYEKTRSQDLEPAFHDVGMFYFYKKNKINTKKTAMYEMEEKYIQDIDTVKDWELAELKYKLFYEHEQLHHNTY